MSIKRQTLWSLAPLLVTAGTAFFSAPLFMRYLNVELYAMYMYIMALIPMFGAADLGLGVVVGRNISMALGKNDLAAVRRYWGTGNLIVLPVLTLATLGYIALFVVAGPRWFDKLAPANIGLFRACVAASGLGLFFAYYGQFWLTVSQAYLDFKFIGLIRAVVSPVQIIPSVFIARYTHNPFWVLAWGSLIVMVQLVILIWHARRHYSLGLCLGSASPACAREMAGFTGKMFLGLMLGAVFAPVLPNLLAKLASTIAFGPFSLANNMAGRLQSLSVSVMGPVLHNTARVADQGRAAAAKIYNDTFAFMFDWCLLVLLWLGLWHPVLLRLYLIPTLGHSRGLATALTVGPLVIPLVAASCLTAMANISNAQLTSFKRMGAIAAFTTLAGLLAVDAILFGWILDGVVGAAYGFLASRLVFVVQDLYTIHLIQARGWLAGGTWRKLAGQSLVAGLFALASLPFKTDSYWLLLPALLHGVSVAAWLLREPLRKFLITKSTAP